MSCSVARHRRSTRHCHGVRASAIDGSKPSRESHAWRLYADTVDRSDECYRHWTGSSPVSHSVRSHSCRQSPEPAADPLASMEDMEPRKNRPQAGRQEDPRHGQQRRLVPAGPGRRHGLAGDACWPASRTSNSATASWCSLIKQGSDAKNERRQSAGHRSTSQDDDGKRSDIAVSRTCTSITVGDARGHGQGRPCSRSSPRRCRRAATSEKRASRTAAVGARQRRTARRCSKTTASPTSGRARAQRLAQLTSRC